MSSYGGRRGQDTVAFIRELNMVDPTDEFLNLDGEDNLDIFRNTTFTDESGVAIDFQAFPQKPDTAADSSASTVSTAAAAAAAASPLDSINPYLDYPYDFTFSPQNMTFAEGLQNLPPLQPAPIDPYGTPVPDQPSQQLHQQDQSKTKTPSRKSLSASPEEEAQVEAEKDKRRRNTAASARFRVKKKLREQALEKKSKELDDKVSQLESKVQQLETENKWLKNLVMEKNEGKEEILSILKSLEARRSGESSDVKPES